MLTVRFARLLLLAALAVLPTLSHALACKEGGRNGNVLITEDIGTTVAVPVTENTGVPIWHSSQRTVNVHCYKDNNVREAEEVYFYPNPRPKQGQPQGVQFGVVYKGQAYYQTERIPTGFSIPQCPSNVSLDKCPAVSFTLSFQVEIATKKPYPGNGQVGINQFEVLQFDGKYGINNAPNSNLVYKVTGLDKIRFIQCAVKVWLNPPNNTLDFGRIVKSNTGLTPSAPRRDFTLGLEKTCDDPVQVNGYFRGINGKKDDYTATLIKQKDGSDSGLGIQLYYGSGNRLRFEQSEFLATFRQGDRLKTVPMYGVIVPTNLGKVEPGPFKGTINIDLDYI
ncbi:fimbrial protein [Chromobacterium amazonense]|uniref:fimbrial protein n=2 Tax=Chromobacterium amazonense TaxID=1382803 RepID=UPI0021B7CF97|nr:fimbrial protein [Chromobacterium amazonense]MBM2883128.1 fimbrial protein [Chromobacterium amazonense]